MNRYLFNTSWVVGSQDKVVSLVDTMSNAVSGARAGLCTDQFPVTNDSSPALAEAVPAHAVASSPRTQVSTPNMVIAAILTLLITSANNISASPVPLGMRTPATHAGAISRFGGGVFGLSGVYAGKSDEMAHRIFGDLGIG